MLLPVGAKLGSYEIAAPLGAGGMGEVYRARDTKLGREVAIKILPELFVGDPERVARFQREAQLLAALNHPHIAAIYGLEESGTTRFLVLELVDGESLADRLARPEGRGLHLSGVGDGLQAVPRNAIPVDEALRIARQIIDALEAAHEKGIIHRDLKPANIMLTHDGQVKVLDFGLAKVETGEAGQAGGAGGATHSPTLTFAATQAGVILGTAAYVSPEQAKGRAADKRSDVWAFGCVLFEMLTGKRAFQGEDVSDTLAAILRGEPEWGALPGGVPAHVQTMVRRCLEKDRRARIPDISVVRFMLDEPIAAPIPPDTVVSEPRRRVTWPWVAATAVFALTTVAGFTGWYLARSTTPAVTRFSIDPPEGSQFAAGGTGVATRAVISPDGRTLAFTARDSASKVLLWIRPIDALAAQPLSGTDGATNPFWSPDSRFIGYTTPGIMHKVGATGGPAQTICRMPGPGTGRGPAWGNGGVIVFNGGAGTLYRVSSGGGEPTLFKRIIGGEYSFPSFLPDGRHVLFYAFGGTSSDRGGVFVADLEEGEPKRLLDADSGGVYAARSGHLLFVRQGTLFAQPFDARSLTVSGEATAIADRLEADTASGVRAFSVSDTGVLAYMMSRHATTDVQMEWVDRQGKSLGTLGPADSIRGIDLSPGGTRVAFHRLDGTGSDLWITDLSRGSTSRFTFDGSQQNGSPIWSPDGTRVAFASNRNGKMGVYIRSAAGGGTDERIFESPALDLLLAPTSWSPDGTSIVFQVSSVQTSSQDLWMVTVSGEHKSRPVVQDSFNERLGQVSPDDYASDKH